MSIADLINGTFELGGGILCWLNVQRLRKDLQIQGVDWRVNAFFSAWGFWNLFYYPSLHQWASFAGGVLLVLANTTWVVLALWYGYVFSRHISEHKAYDPDCEFCRKAFFGFRVPEVKSLNNLPEIKHTYKCECDLCKDR
jgi:hypothetical protein